MTLNLRMVLQADSGAAKAALDDTARGIKGVTAATGEQATKSRAAATAADSEAAAKRRNAQASTAMATANRNAAGATGNLVAQLNDVGLMLAAGQNPLQLAIQQGTQITQVIGPMGAGGAVKALGGAFLGLLNPINLVTLGVIAAAGYTLQWLTGAEEKADRVKDLLVEVAEASSKTQSQIDKLQFGVDEQYQVDLLSEQLTLRREYNQKVGELNNYLATTSDSLDRQRITAAAMVADIQDIVDRYTEIDRALAIQQNRQTQLSIIEGIRAQRAGELKARQAEAAAEAERQHRAMVSAHEVYARTRKEGDELAEAAARAGVSAEALSHIEFGYIAAASTEALRLAGHLGIALDVASRLAALGPQGIGGNDPSGKTYGGRGRAPTQGEIVDMRVAGTFGWRTPPTPGRVGSGGGAAAARDEASALDELIASLEAEIEALRIQDPIQKELLEHRKALEGATEAERQKVEELIAARERERAAMEAITQVQDFLESTVDSAFEALIVKGESLQDVLKGVIAALAKAAIQAAIFGSGPLGSIFGNVGIGELLFGGGKAEGGMVHGPGTGTSDSILTALSNGEYVVNARATAKNRHLLEAINAGGRIGGYAEGGFVGSDNRRMAARGDGGSPTFNINLAGARGDREIEEAAHRGMKRALQEYDRDSLPGSVKRISRDQKRVG